MSIRLVVLVDNVSRQNIIRSYHRAVEEQSWNDGDCEQGILSNNLLICNLLLYLDESYNPSSKSRKRKRRTDAPLRNSWKEFVDAPRSSFPGEIPSPTMCRERHQQFENSTRPSDVKQLPCCICGTLHEHIVQFPVSKLAKYKDMLQVPESYSMIPHDQYYTPGAHSLLSGTILEKSGLDFDNNGAITSGNVCNTCEGSMLKNKLPLLAYANEMWARPENLPEELSDLTFLEWKLLALSRPSVTVMRLVSHTGDFRSTQRGYKASCVSYPQPVDKLPSVLPVRPADIADFLRVVFISVCKPIKRHTANFLGVRPEKVRAALLYLIAHNPLYTHIRIDEDILDEYLNIDLDNIIIDSIDDASQIDDAEHAGYVDEDETQLQQDESDTQDSTIVCNGMIDTTGATHTHNEIALSALQAIKGEKDGQPQQPFLEGNETLFMPRSNQPHNEYEDTDFIGRSYPELFPFGVGYPGSTTRSHMVPLGKHLQYNLMHCSRKFARHSSYMFHLLNILQRRKSCFQAKLQTKRKDFDRVCQAPKDITSTDVEAALAKEEKDYPPNLKLLLDKVYSIGNNIPGSQAYLKERRKEIQAMIVRHGPPHFFLTLNPADIHSPLMLHLAGEEVNLSSLLFKSATYRSRILAANPVAQALYFDKVIKSIFQVLLGFGSDDQTGVLGNSKGFYGVYEAQGRGSLHIHSLIWLKERLHIPTLRERMMDEDFQLRVIKLLDHTVSQRLDTLTTEWDDPAEVSNYVKLHLQATAIHVSAATTQEQSDEDMQSGEGLERTPPSPPSDVFMQRTPNSPRSEANIGDHDAPMISATSR
jgi:hypothetical protein